MIFTVSNAATGAVGFAQKTSTNSSGLSMGAIVDIAVVVVVAGILIYLVIRKCRGRRDSSDSGYKELIYSGGVTLAPQPDWVVTPFTPDATSTASSPMSSYVHGLPRNDSSVLDSYSGTSEPTDSAMNLVFSSPPLIPLIPQTLVLS